MRRALPSVAARALVATCLGLAALGAAAASALAAVQVTIQPAGGGSPATVSTDAVSPDIDTTYTVRTAAGGTERVRVENGVSVLKLLEQTQTDFDYSVIELARPDGSTLRLTKDQVEDVRPPAFFTDAQGITRFLGPSDERGQVAAEDYFEVSGTVTLTQQRPSKLHVKISPREKEIEVGGSVRFKVDVSGAEPEEQLVYTWGIKGRRQVDGGATHTQRFPKEDGVYKMLVAVSIEGSEVSVSDVAKITVGDPEESDKDRDGGGTDTTGGADSGASTGSGGAGSSYGGGSSYTPTYTPAPSTPPAPAPDPPQTPSPEPPDSPDLTTSGTTVEGNLLADVSDPAASSILESAARAARDGTPKDDGPDGAGVPEAALSIAGVLALLGLGAGMELRQGRRPRLRLPRLPRRAA